MKILSVDSTATPASVCLYDGGIIADYYIRTALTHSRTLTAMIESVLKVTDTRPEDIDCYAVDNGPGSFTGVRIGVSVVKGMAYAQDKPCVEVSTLECIARNFTVSEGVVCACMDARRQQFYNALFRVHGGRIERLCGDRAIGADELIAELRGYDERIIVAGDGGELFYSLAYGSDNIVLAPEAFRYQRASSAAIIAAERSISGETLSAASLMPTYLRLSQAERELKNKQEIDKE